MPNSRLPQALARETGTAFSVIIPVTSQVVLAWMDLEMTGLDPSQHTIVEIAALVTDDDLTIVAEGPDLVIGATDEQLQAMNSVVRHMHQHSGLLDEMAQSDLSLAEAGRLTIAFLKEHLPQPGQVPLAGNSIGVDRRFLSAQLPDVEKWFHYRSVDVSSIKELCRRWYPEVLDGAPSKATTHRALDDIRESVAELVYYRQHIFCDPSQQVAPVEDASTERSES